MELPNNPTGASHTEADDTIDLLGVLLTIGENLRLLVLGSLLAGALAYGFALLLPPKFESTAVLRAEPSVAAYMTAPAVLDAALQKLGYLKGLDEEEAETAREKLLRNIKARAGRKDKPVTLTVTGPSPEAAQALGNEILVNVFAGSRPRGDELRRLGAERAVLAQQAAELARVNQKAQKLLDKASPADNLGALAESISAISITLIKIREDIHAVDKKMLGLTDNDLVQSPTLPKEPASPGKGLLAILSTSGAGLALLIFVFMRQSWRASSSFEKHQERLHALKRRYSLAR